MKKILALISFLFLINSVSAYSQIDDFFNFIEPTTLFLIIIFIVSFAFIHFALMRTLKDKTMSMIVALGGAILITYGLYNSDFAYSFSSITDWIRRMTWKTLLIIIGVGVLIYWILKEEGFFKRKNR